MIRASWKRRQWQLRDKRRVLVASIMVLTVLPAVALSTTPVSAAVGDLVISTVAGTGSGGFGGDGGHASAATLAEPFGVTVDSLGNVFIAESGGHRIRKIDPSGAITTVAGSGARDYAGDGGPAVDAALNSPFDVAVDAAGNLYIADGDNAVIRKVDTSGTITTFASTGARPFAVALDAAGNLYVAAPERHQVLKIDPSGAVSVFAGTGEAGFGGDDGSAQTALLNSPYGVAIDGAGGVLISDAGNNRIRRVDPSGTITTVVGTGEAGFGGDGGPASAALLNSPIHVSVDEAGNFYFADQLNHRVRKVDTAGTITTVAGTGEPGYAGDLGPATSALLNHPTGVEALGPNVVLIAEPLNHVVRRVAPDLLTLTKTDSADPIEAGQALDYSLTVTNHALSAATAVVLTDTLPTAVDFVGATASQGSCTEASGTVTCALGDLASKASATVTISVASTESAVLTNRAIARSNETNPPMVNNTAIETTLVSVANLSVTKSASAESVEFNEPISYTMVVANAGPSEASSVTLTDTLPAGVTFSNAVASQGSCAHAGGTVTCDLGSIPSGADVTVTIDVTNSQLGLQVNTASVSASQADPDPADNTATAETEVVTDLLVLTKTDSPDPVEVGDQLIYTLSVANGSPLAATGVMLTDTLPVGVSFVGASASQGSCSQADGTVTCALGDLASGATATATITVTPTAAALITNTAEVHANEEDPTPENNTVSEDTSVGLADLRLTKTASPPLPTPNQPVTYTLNVENAGPSPAGAVTLTDTLPSGVTFGSVSTSQGACNHASGTVTCELGTLAAGRSATTRIHVTVGSLGDVHTNTASVSVAPQQDPVLDDNTATLETKVSSPDCGKVITRNTTLTRDIGPCAGDGVILGRDNVTLNLARHRIFGFPGRGSDNTAGIVLQNRTGTKIINGTVSEFDAGIMLVGGGSNLIRQMTVSDNVGPDDDFNAQLGDGIVLFGSSFNEIVNNVVVRNGVYNGIGLWGEDTHDNRIKNNIVEDNVGVTDRTGGGTGIMINGAGGVSAASFIDRTVVSRNQVRRNAAGGISNINHRDGLVERNIVEENGQINDRIGGSSVGRNGIALNTGFAGRGSPSRTVIRNNFVRASGADGIQVTSGTAEGRVVNNTSIDNNRFDLADFNLNCGTNFWFGNRWGSGGFNQPCTAAGGAPAPGVPMASLNTAGPQLATASASASAPADGDVPPPRRPPARFVR